jgi:hypothetical protein
MGEYYFPIVVEFLVNKGPGKICLKRLAGRKMSESELNRIFRIDRIFRIGESAVGMELVAFNQKKTCYTLLSLSSNEGERLQFTRA